MRRSFLLRYLYLACIHFPLESSPLQLYPVARQCFRARQIGLVSEHMTLGWQLSTVLRQTCCAIYGQAQGAVGLAMHGGSESQVRTWHSNGVFNFSHCLPPKAATFSSRTVSWFSRPNIHVESEHTVSGYPVSYQHRISCSIPAKAGRKSWPAVRPRRCVVVSKDLSTDIFRPGPACDCPCSYGGSLSLDALVRLFSLAHKRRMRLLPPRLGPYSIPHAGACLQMNGVAINPRLQWFRGLPSRC